MKYWILLFSMLHFLVNVVTQAVVFNPSIYIQTGLTTVTNPINGNVYNQTFWRSFSTPPRGGVIINGLDQASFSGNFSIRLTSVITLDTQINFTFSQQFTPSTIFTSITIAFIAIDVSITYAKFFQYQIVENEYAPYPAAINTSNTFIILGYFTSLTYSTIFLTTPTPPTPGIAKLSIVVSLFNETHCSTNLTNGDYTYLQYSSPVIGIVLVDQTLSDTFKHHYYDVFTSISITTGSASTVTTIIGAHSSTFFAGLNSFEVTPSQPFKLLFTTSGNTTTLSSTGTFTSYSLGLLNIRFRSCPPSFPQWMQSEILCYDICPRGYYAFPVQHYCAPCMYSCSQCSTSTTCKLCTVTSNRFFDLNGSTNGIDGQCTCLTYFYDDKTNINCLSCHYSCQFCYNSSINSCLTCNTSDHRFISYENTVDNKSIPIGTCKCGLHFYDIGVSLCSECHYMCLSCSDLNTCLTCPSSRTLNTATNTCDCIVGYTDYGSATCQKQQNFRTMSAILYLSFLVFMFFLIIDRFKIQYIEGLWIIQLTFFCVAFGGTQAYYAPIRALANIINGYNSLQNVQFNTLATSHGLAALKIKSVFLGNANIMPALALGIFITGFLIWVIDKVILNLPDQLTKISNYFMYDGVFSMVLFNTLNVFFSFGAQIDFYITEQPFTLSSIVLNWVYIVALMLLQIWISYQYLVHYEKFTVVNDSLKKDPLNVRHPLIMGVIRAIQGFSLGIGYSWEIIPMQILVIEFIVVVYLIIKRPYKSKIDAASSIFNQIVIFVIILLKIFQFQGTFHPIMSRITINWVQVILILISLLKTIIFFYYKTYKHYASTKSDPMNQIKMDFGATGYNYQPSINPTKTVEHFFPINDQSYDQLQGLGAHKRRTSI